MEKFKFFKQFPPVSNPWMRSSTTTSFQHSLAEKSQSKREYIITIPIREGGLVLRRVAENADRCYDLSVKIKLPPTAAHWLTAYSHKQTNFRTHQPSTKWRKPSLQKWKKNERTRESPFEEPVKSQLTSELHRNSQPGASSGLGALPIATHGHGFNLNKHLKEGLARKEFKMKKVIKE